MSDLRTIETSLRQLRHEVATLAQCLSPWIGSDEMARRYGVTGKTLTAMERRGDIPQRVHGRWNRAEVMQWESREPAGNV